MFTVQETIQKLTELPVVRGRKHPRKKVNNPVHQERQKGTRKASIRDWHSFRVTWITLALASGIPMEIVTKATGHQTVDVVNRHYWRPHREQIRQAFTENMPGLLCTGMASRTDRAIARTKVRIKLLRDMTADNWQSRLDEVLEVLSGKSSE